MTLFEKALINKGYIRFVYDKKTDSYKQVQEFIISSMVNLNHIYFHESDPIIEKIKSGVKLAQMSDKDREKQIIFGLNEYGKPATLIYPRPRIEISRLINGCRYVLKEEHDDNMNYVLMNYSFEEIFTALYDKSIIFKGEV